MINAKSFYLKRGTKFTKFCVLNQAISHGSNNETTEIVAPPSNAGNQEIDSDIENLPDDLNENTVDLSSIFEPAGEVEVIDVNEDGFVAALSVEVARPKQNKNLIKFRKKATTFDKDIHKELLGNFADAYQHLTL